jgi:hypothetical protein
MLRKTKLDSSSAYDTSCKMISFDSFSIYSSLFHDIFRENLMQSKEFITSVHLVDGDTMINGRQTHSENRVFNWLSSLRLLKEW